MISKPSATSFFLTATPSAPVLTSVTVEPSAAPDGEHRPLYRRSGIGIGFVDRQVGPLVILQHHSGVPAGKSSTWYSVSSRICVSTVEIS